MTSLVKKFQVFFCSVMSMGKSNILSKKEFDSFFLNKKD